MFRKTNCEIFTIFATSLLFVHPSQRILILKILQQHQFTAPSVLICTWIRRLNMEYLVTDLWQFFLSPDEHHDITRLNTEESNLDFDFVGRFMVFGE